ncbi:MAG: SusE domain-containing protein [Bacteroidetes bacterium]|nr:SusE domain-containing protein [Bacteroidota bacterium]
MKYLSKIFLSILTASIVLIACRKEGALPNYAASSTPVLSASKTSIAPAPSDSNTAVATLNWTDPMLSTDSAYKMYVIEIDSTGRNFKQAAKITVYGTLSKALIGKELNSILLNFGFKFNVAYDIDVRLTSSYVNNNDIKVSNTLKLSATPYKVPPKVELPSTGKLYIVGGATNGGWSNPVPTPTQEFTRIDETTFMGVFDLSSGGSYLLLAVNGGWDEKFGALGSNNSNNVAGDNFKKGGGDLLAPATTTKYLITVDFQQGKFTVVPYTGPTLPSDLFIVGGATPGSWSNPVPTPSQQFVRLNSCEFEIASLNLNQANGMYLLLPVNGSWASKYGGVGSSNGSNEPLGDSFKEGGSDLKAPDVVGNYKMNINFATAKYKLTKL